MLTPYAVERVISALQVKTWEDVPDSLKSELIEIDDLCQLMQGQIKSRQILAHAIFDWKRRQK